MVFISVPSNKSWFNFCRWWPQKANIHRYWPQKLLICNLWGGQLCQKHPFVRWFTETIRDPVFSAPGAKIWIWIDVGSNVFFLGLGLGSKVLLECLKIKWPASWNKLHLNLHCYLDTDMCVSDVTRDDTRGRMWETVHPNDVRKSNLCLHAILSTQKIKHLNSKNLVKIFLARIIIVLDASSDVNSFCWTLAIPTLSS